MDIWLGPQEHDDEVVACENTLTPGSGVSVLRVEAGSEGYKVAGKCPSILYNTYPAYPSHTVYTVYFVHLHS